MIFHHIFICQALKNKIKNTLTSILNWSRKFSSKAKILIEKEIHVLLIFELSKRKILLVVELLPSFSYRKFKIQYNTLNERAGKSTPMCILFTQVGTFCVYFLRFEHLAKFDSCIVAPLRIA